MVRVLEAKQAPYTSHWLDNSISLPNAPEVLIAQLERMEEVGSVEEDATIWLPSMNELLGNDSGLTNGQAGDGKPQTNIAALKTGALWAKGITGAGITVATIDSGVRWTHEALRHNYR